MKKSLLFVMALMASLAMNAQEPILTFKGTVGEEVSLTFGVWETEDTYSVDFGDGNLQTAKVGIDNKGPVQEDGSTPTATKFTGTVAGDGTIKVYGTNDVWYLTAEGGVVPASFDQSKLMNVVQMSISGADVASVALPAYEKMTQFSFNNSSVKTLDVSKVATLTSLTVLCTDQSKYAPQLESIDLSKNGELNYLSIQGTKTSIGKLTTIDLSNNTKLQNVYLQCNQLATVTLPAGAALTYLNLQDNQLEALDLTALGSITNAWLENNKLKTLALGNVTKVCKFENNQLSLATLPSQPASMNSKTKTKNFTYAPQAAFQVPATVNELDLSSQLTVAKGELSPDADADAGIAAYSTWVENANTTFSFVTESGAALVEGTDFTVTAPGKFKFIKEQAEKVHGVMLNAAFPKFTEAVPFVTTDFTVSASEAQNDTTYVMFDFNLNPWNKPTSRLAKTKQGNWHYKVDYEDTTGALYDTTTFDWDVDGEKIEITFTAVDLDEYQYPNYMVKGVNDGYKDVNGEDSVLTMLYALNGTTMRVKAPASKRIGKMVFWCYRYANFGVTTDEEIVDPKTGAKASHRVWTLETPQIVPNSELHGWSGDDTDILFNYEYFNAYFEKIEFRLVPRTATGIQELTSMSTSTSKETYDLMGRKVSTPQKKGIYIINGKKVVIR